MFFTAIILGIIEGLTEFIPVSSTGHLILFGDILGFEAPKGKVFEIVIQLGAIFAICVLYRAKIFTTTIGVIKRKPADMRFTAGLLIAFMPAMILGALLHEFIMGVLFSPFNVSVMLIIGGVVILLAERFKPKVKYKNIDDITPLTCLKIGLCQCIALIPGTSRSGATIIGALMLGVDRKAAAEFSFFLAIPTMLAATVFQIYGNYSQLDASGIQLIAAGFVAAFISAILVVKWVIGYIEKHGFAPFAWYRIGVGALMLVLL